MILKTHTQVLYFSYTQAYRQCFKWYIVLPGRLAIEYTIYGLAQRGSAQTAANFGEHDISKCLNNLFLALEQTNRNTVVLQVLAIYNVTHMINRVVGGIVFKRHRDQTITKCLYNQFLAIERTCRISLVGFSDLQCVSYVSIYVTFLK